MSWLNLAQQGRSTTCTACLVLAGRVGQDAVITQDRALISRAEGREQIAAITFTNKAAAKCGRAKTLIGKASGRADLHLSRAGRARAAWTGRCWAEKQFSIWTVTT
jgi:hypothetical protein